MLTTATQNTPVHKTGTGGVVKPEDESVDGIHIDSHPLATPPPAPVQSMPGDDFFTDDALGHLGHPPPPPPPVVPEPPPPPPPVPFPDNVAVIMETDPSTVSNLVPIILHFMTTLGPRWPVVLLTRLENWVEPKSPAFLRAMAEQRIRIMFLPPEITFPDHHSVSVFYTDPWIWEQFESAGRMLMFQADSVLCAKSALTVEDFVQYDFVGAPIGPQHGHGYNGGLSLRNPRLLLEITRDPRFNFRLDSDQGQPSIPNEKKFEDQWFYMRLKERGANLPEVAVARTFSVETMYYATPLGYHQPARWQAARMKSILEWCPEVGMIQKDSQHFLGKLD